MRREATIPLFLWVATAALAHLLWGGGADRGARLIDERLDVGRFAAGVRSHVRNSMAPPIEIAFEDDPVEEEKPEEKAEEPAKDEAPSEEEEAPEDVKEEPAKPKPEPTPPKDKAQAEPEPPPLPDAPKPEPAKPAAVVEEPKVIPQLELPKRIAVKQHVDNEKQEANPDAQLLADHNNRVKEETVARITSTDQDAKKPSPGSSPSAPPEAPGNAEETNVRQDSDQAGERGKPSGGTDSKEATRASAAAAAEQSGKVSGSAPSKPGAASPPQPTPAQPAGQDKNQTAQAATPERAGMPEVVASQDGSFSIKGPEAATPEKPARKAKKRLPPRRPKSLMEALGLGSAGRTENGVSLNLTPTQAVAAVGAEEMSRLRRTDGERRRSQHRGSWRTPSFERYRSAIENYVPSIKRGNQTALNTAAAPFASYLNQIHNRIHPIFADDFLGSLDRLPASHPMNDPTLVTAVEIVVEREEGRLVRRGVVTNSGDSAFDLNALVAIDKAAPFGTPPSEIVSPDGNVYLHWEFRRDHMMCSTLHAHPFIKRAEPKPAPLPTAPPQPPFRGPDDPTPPPAGDRHGQLPPARAPQEPAPPG